MAHGQDALNVAFDLPTQLGLDSDDPRAEGEVGRVGMAIDTLADMEDAFAGIPLDRVSVSLTIRSEEHTSELQSLAYLVCRLLLEKKKKRTYQTTSACSE